MSTEPTDLERAVLDITRGRAYISLDSLLLEIALRGAGAATKLATAAAAHRILVDAGWRHRRFHEGPGKCTDTYELPASDRPAAQRAEPASGGESAKAPTAPDILATAARCIAQRAATRDLPAERSMARAVSAFNALAGASLSERDGWLFMVVLKAARATAGSHNADDYVDGAAYFALAGESAEPGAQ